MLLAIQILATVSMVLSLLAAVGDIERLGIFITALVLVGILIVFLWLWVLPGLIILLSTAILGQLIKLVK